jgi:hypothetical protein
MSLSEQAQTGIAEQNKRRSSRQLAPTLAAVVVIELVQIGNLGVIMRAEGSMSSRLEDLTGERRQSNFMATRVRRSGFPNVSHFIGLPNFW